MTGEEIRQLAELHTEDLPIETSQALLFINECMLMDLSKDAGIVGNDEVVATKDVWVAVDTTFLSIFEIWKSGQKAPYYGAMYGEGYDGEFDLRDNYIRFPEDGTYAIHGFVIPTPITALTDTPGVHPLLHYPMSIYVAARATFWDDEENPAYDKKMQEYFLWRSRVMEQLDEMRPTTQKPRRMKIRPYV